MRSEVAGQLPVAVAGAELRADPWRHTGLRFLRCHAGKDGEPDLGAGWCQGPSIAGN